MHIPPHLILPQDMVDIFDHGPVESEPDAEAWHKRHGDGPAVHRMHVSDAKHAIAVAPERYTVTPTRPEPDVVTTDHPEETHLE